MTTSNIKEIAGIKVAELKVWDDLAFVDEI